VVARVNTLYITLHNLLHPSPPSEAQEQLAGLVDGFTSNSDWVHLILAINKGMLPPLIRLTV
jgi:hypothetical protein